MKIAVISSSIFSCPPNGYAGLEMISWHCAKGLAAKGHQVTLIAPIGSYCPGCEVFECLPQGFAEEAMYSGCTWKNVNGEDIRWPGYWHKLLEFNDGGCIIDHSWNKWPLMLKAEGRLTCPILNVLHAPVNTMITSLPPVPKPCFVAISKDQKDHFDALFSPAKAKVCHNGVDIDYYKPINIPRNNRYLFLARFSTIKGPDIAIDSCKKVNESLDLIGDTSITNEPELFNHCKNQADGEKIRIIGSVSRSETVWWYSQASALLHPNLRFREPFGLAPVEAMLAGCPVIAWDYGAMRETIKHGETGFLVNSQQELEELIKNRATDSINRERCREWAMQFSIDRMASRYEELCKEAVETGGW